MTVFSPTVPALHSAGSRGEIQSVAKRLNPIGASQMLFMSTVLSLLLAGAAPSDSATAIFAGGCFWSMRSEEHTSELQSQSNLVCRLLLGKKKQHTLLSLTL